MTKENIRVGMTARLRDKNYLVVEVLETGIVLEKEGQGKESRKHLSYDNAVFSKMEFLDNKESEIAEDASQDVDMSEFKKSESKKPDDKPKQKAPKETKKEEPEPAETEDDEEEAGLLDIPEGAGNLTLDTTFDIDDSGGGNRTIGTLWKLCLEGEIQKAVAGLYMIAWYYREVWKLDADTLADMAFIQNLPRTIETVADIDLDKLSLFAQSLAKTKNPTDETYKKMFEFLPKDNTDAIIVIQMLSDGGLTKFGYNGIKKVRQDALKELLDIVFEVDVNI